MSGIVVFTFDNSNREDIVRIQYEAGSNPGSTRLVIFRELTDLRHKGPGFKATDDTGSRRSPRAQPGATAARLPVAPEATAARLPVAPEATAGAVC